MKVPRCLRAASALAAGLALAVLGCAWPGWLPTPSPLPPPTALGAAPPPAGSQPGGFEGVFRSVWSQAGADGQRCHQLVRFYADGVALEAPRACFDPEVEPVAASVDDWFQREDGGLPHGDYFVDGAAVYVRIVSHDAVHQTTTVQNYQGRLCGERLMLQALRTEPARPGQQPVHVYQRLAGTSETATPTAGCHVAHFEFIFRADIVLAGHSARWTIRSDPGQRCELQYRTPDGTLSAAPELGARIADAQGVCEWVWPVREAPGEGLVTLTLDGVTQDYAILLR